jgi:1-deoxy-D-xylulose-5-phosphate reductoisomerase
MVEFEDGSIKAQLGTPDMHMPISYALMFPQRAVRGEHFSFAENPTLTFAKVDRVKYPALDIAYNCLRAGGTAACTMNGANEVAVAAFLDHKCGYLDIVGSIEYALNKAQFVKNPTLEDYAAANIESRRLACEYLKITE